MTDFPRWQDYQPPDFELLGRLALEYGPLREVEVSDPRSAIDNRTAVRVYLLQQGVRGVLFERLVEPYDLGFYLRSDGKSTPIPGMRLRAQQAAQGFCKDIVSVRHDLDYYRGLPGRAAADHWYHLGQRALGEQSVIAAAEYLCLRAVGWAAWRRHARKRATIPGYGSDAHIHRMPRIACHHAGGVH